MAILTVARLTLREASRRRLLLAVVLLTIFVGLLSAWAFHRLLQLPCGVDGESRPCTPAEIKLLAATLLILLMFMYSFVLALGAAFLGAPSIANEMESGVLLSILPRPILRSDVVLGKWLGLALLIATYASLSCAIEFVILNWATNYLPPHPVLAIVFVVGEALVVLTLTLLGSTRIPAMTCGIIVLVLFGITWIAGTAGSVGAARQSQAIQNIGTVSSLILPTDGLWRAAIYNIQPAAIRALESASGVRGTGNPFFSDSPPSATYLLWTFGWVVTLLAAACWSFSRRDL